MTCISSWEAFPDRDQLPDYPLTEDERVALSNQTQDATNAEHSMTPETTNPNAIYYLAGPMAGYPDHNHPAFHKAAATLRACGHVVVNPAEYGNLIMLGWQGAMKRDLHAMLWCDALVMLPGWEKSRGARLETRTAWDLEMPIYSLDVMLCDCIRPHVGAMVWHTESCLARRVPISTIPADDLTTVAMYARTYADGEPHAAAGRVLQGLGKLVSPL